MNSMKKDGVNTPTDSRLVEEARKTLIGAKDWLLEDVALMGAYWHDKMGYTEAWIDANWHLVLEEGQDLIHELDEKEDAALLWLINHVNNNPVPLQNCHVVGDEVPAGEYTCMACGHNNLVLKSQSLNACEVCHYGLLSSHD
ncbi:hypothetical protein [Marinomonas sp.]